MNDKPTQWNKRLHTLAARNAATATADAERAIENLARLNEGHQTGTLPSGKRMSDDEGRAAAEDARTLGERLPATLLQMAARALVELRITDLDERKRKRLQLERVTAATGPTRHLALTGLLIELLQEDLEAHEDAPDRSVDEYAVTRITDRIFAGGKAEQMPEHTIVTGGSPARRSMVLKAVAARLKTGGSNAVACVDGRELGATGTEAIWRMAAGELGLKETGEDIDPLGRLLNACPTGGQIAVLVDGVDELIVNWGNNGQGNPEGRHSIWNLRHTMQNEPRVVFTGSAGTWPPAGTSAIDSGAYASFAIINLGK